MCARQMEKNPINAQTRPQIEVYQCLPRNTIKYSSGWLRHNRKKCESYILRDNYIKIIIRAVISWLQSSLTNVECRYLVRIISAFAEPSPSEHHKWIKMKLFRVQVVAGLNSWGHQTECIFHFGRTQPFTSAE